MYLPDGNKFWNRETKRGVKQGRRRTYPDAEELWKACVEYFDYTSKRKWKEAKWVGKESKKVYVTHEVPFTIEGLSLYIGVYRDYLSRRLKELKPEESEDDADFYDVITRVQDIIRTQKFEGAAIGAFNQTIISQDLGMKNKVEIDIGEEKERVKNIFPTMEEFEKVLQEKEK